MFKYFRAHYIPAWRFASRQFLYACLLDQHSVKPGNVGVHGEGHGKSYQDFRQSASAAAEPVTHPSWSLGKRIYKAARATWDVVGCNTNLGVLLLVAPLAMAHHRKEPADFGQRLQAVLDEATIGDARDVYKAIRLMNPAGLGRTAQADVNERPDVSLQEAMALAAKRDRIAAEYSEGFPVVLGEARSQWEDLCRKWGDEHWAMTGTFLQLLARYPDSHIARVHGEETARQISGKIRSLADEFCAAQAPETCRSRLLELDALWKSADISPGTTADLTLAGVFAARLGGWGEGRDE